MTSIYSLKSSLHSVAVDRVWEQGSGGIATGYTALTTAPVGTATALFAYDRASQKADVYMLDGCAPWVQAAHTRQDVAGPAWDNLTSFVLGNEPYLMAYEREHGTFGFFHIAQDLSVSAPYTFAAPRNTPTHGFSTVAIYTSLGQTTFTGYSFDTGTVANFNLSVTPTSSGGVPALLAQNVWYHQWAKGWTRFAFFQLGGANFFFKINTAKLNVNIDHMLDNPALGSVEVGSYLQEQLPDALSITNAAHVPWADGEPYLLTYIAPSGTTAVYRIHADCQGWTRVHSGPAEKHAAQVIPYRIGSASYALLYHDK
jgi:hypothetical protein